jgi:hypothetical protein
VSESNNFFIFKCYYCNYQADIAREYECHVVLKHPGKLAYPSEIDVERWESKSGKQLIDRTEQGRILAQMDGSVKRNGETSYTVNSQSGDGSYDVKVTEIGWNCSWPDSTYRGVKCKHIHAVELSLLSNT